MAASSRPGSSGRFHVGSGCRLLAAFTAALLAPATLAAAPSAVPAGGAARAGIAPAPGAKRIVDPAVTPAIHSGCVACGPAGCRHGHAAGHHAGCRDGQCVPFCPVRPQQFGFYGTRWRRWPGQDVVPVSGERTAMPVEPPRSAIPKASEESLNPPSADLPPPADGTEPPATPAPEQPAPLPEPPAPLPEPPAPMPEPPAPMPEPPAPPAQGGVEAPQPGPAAPLEPATPTTSVKPSEPAVPGPLPTTPAVPAPIPEEPAAPAPAPEAKPQPKPPADAENLFDVDSGWRARRRFPASRGPLEPSTAEGEVRPAGHEAATARPPVPRVPFDPAAETRRLRQAR